MELFSTRGFMPHGYCLSWTPGLVEVTLLTNLLIFLSYMFISIVLWKQMNCAREVMTNTKIVFAFGNFIFACGLTHLVDTITIFKPMYWVAALVLSWTAVASIATVLALPQAVNDTRELIYSFLSRKQLEEKLKGEYRTKFEDLEKKYDQYYSQIEDLNNLLQVNATREMMEEGYEKTGMDRRTETEHS